MTIISAAMNKCYRYGRIILLRQNNSANFCLFFWLLHYNLAHTYTAGAIMRSTRTFVITVSSDRVSCPARTLTRNFAHAAAVIVTCAHCCLTAVGHCYVMLGTIKFVDKSLNNNSARRLGHCAVIAWRYGFGVATDVPHSDELQTEFKSFTVAHLGSNTNQHTWRHMHQIQQVSLCSSFSTIRAITFIWVQRGLQCSLGFQEQDGRNGGSVRAMRCEFRWKYCEFVSFML